jgi:uncharacterized protein YebE (UPF0316 family)
MQKILIQLVIYLVVGFIEMFIATQRMSFVAKGRVLAATAIVFVENIVYFIILYQLINNAQGNWQVFVAYSMGGSLGTFVNLKKGA